MNRCLIGKLLSRSRSRSFISPGTRYYSEQQQQQRLPLLQYVAFFAPLKMAERSMIATRCRSNNNYTCCLRFFSSSSSSSAIATTTATSASETTHEILLYPHYKLRQPNREVTLFDDDLRARASVLTDLMYRFDGVGLAAPQVGMNEKMLVFPREVFEDTEDSYDSDDNSDYKGSGGGDNDDSDTMTLTKGDAVVMCNPRVVKSSWRQNVCEEGCLSFPGIHVDIVRPESVTVLYQDLEGVEHKVELQGLGARVFQHENDHLNQVLFIDHFPREERAKHQRQLDEMTQTFGEGGLV